MRIKIDEIKKLDKYLSNLSDSGEDFKALILKLVYELKDLEKVSKLSGVAVSTIYEWVRKWNKCKEMSLENFRGVGGGRKHKLTMEERNQLKKELSSRSYWTTKEVIKLTEDLFNVSYSISQIRRILRNFGMNLSKPYPLDYRRPDNADDILEERLRQAYVQLAKNGISNNDVAIGMLDESSPQTTANTVRVWSFGKVKVKKTLQK